MYRFSIFVLLLLLGSLRAEAVVDMKSASYANAWLDIDIPNDGFQTKIIRVYKSRTVFDGIFGFGWCTLYESKLTVTAEGALKIAECGSGHETVYSPSPVSSAMIEKTVTLIIEKMKLDPARKNLSADYLGGLKRRLLEDDEHRSELAMAYELKPKLEAGKSYLAGGTGAEKIEFLNTHFLRKKTDGVTERYDLQGRLVQLTDPQQSYIKLQYQNNLLIRIEDNNANFYSFKYNAAKKVSEIKGPTGHHAIYTYSGGNLVRAEVKLNGKLAKSWNYQYDGFHNLIAVTDNQKNKIAITYDTQRDWVLSYSADNCTEKYSYRDTSSKTQPRHISESKKYCGKKLVSTRIYELWYERLSSGVTSLVRAVTTKDGVTDDLTFDPHSGKKLRAVTGGADVRFAYGKSGLLKTRTSKTSIQEYTYLKDQPLIASCKSTLLDGKGKPKGAVTTKAVYDSKRRPASVSNSLGEKTLIYYDELSRPAKVINEAKTVFLVKYDERMNKISQINMVGTGVVAIEYKRNGKVGRVHTSNPKIDPKAITSAFERSLDVLTPVEQESLL